jgi:hypothetical protein
MSDEWCIAFERYCAHLSPLDLLAMRRAQHLAPATGTNPSNSTTQE